MQLAQDISSRMHVKKRRRSGLRRGFLPISYAFAYEIYNRRNRQVKMRQLFFYRSLLLNKGKRGRKNVVSMQRIRGNEHGKNDSIDVFGQ